MLSAAAGRRSGKHHDRVGRPSQVVGASDRVFGLGGSAIAAAVAIAGPLRGGEVHWWLVAVAAVLGVAGLLAPRVLSPLNRAWMAIGHGLSRVTSPVVLGLVYAIAIIPGGLVMRLRGRDPLTRAFDSDATTYWTPRPRDPDDMTRQF